MLNVPTYVLTYLRSYLPTFLPTYVLTYLCSYLPTFLPTYILTYLRSYLPTFLPTYVLTYLGTRLLNIFKVQKHYQNVTFLGPKPQMLTYVFCTLHLRLWWLTRSFCFYLMLRQSSLFTKQLVTLNSQAVWDEQLLLHFSLQLPT